jgi:hypothetical protein
MNWTYNTGLNGAVQIVLCECGRDKLMVCVFIKHYLQLGECGRYFKLSFIHTHGHCHYISHLFHNVSLYDTSRVTTEIYT